MIVNYILINAGFVLVGFLLSYVFNFARWFSLDHAHDMGLGNLFLSTSLFAILGFVITGYLFYDHRVLLIISCVAIVGLVLFLWRLFA
ncbi:hypothetical protein JMN32_23980 [Fulvivirga sp. 29W222]|uniref:Uncharacterized protein n=1 Tax=Fulvivirga marina TaxID=2494733 RepID=A0A937G2B9_9BACT|nr:hypothetical protein [Fulvivirga marina]MBL6449392.1 hypothetical protein [Fulvivirga marina]